MPDTSSSRLPLLVLSVALGSALLVIAFLLGRESARTTTAVETKVPAPPVLEPVATTTSETEERRWPKWADLQEWEDLEDPYATEPTFARIEEQPDGTVLLSNREPTSETPRVPNDSSTGEPESEVSAYFLQMDVIRSEAGAGDPNSFAMDLIKATMGGSTSGFSQLISDTERMEQEARKVKPPPSCEDYHQANLDALAESHAVLEDMKTAILRRDIGELTAIAQQAAALQAKAKALQDMRRRILADAQR